MQTISHISCKQILKMSANKQNAPSKTVSFRLPSGAVDAINKAAKEKGLTVQEYFLSQILPGSELSTILLVEQQKLIEQSQNIANARDRMAKDALKIRESLGLSEDAFETAAVQALKMLLKNVKTDNSNKG